MPPFQLPTNNPLAPVQTASAPIPTTAAAPTSPTTFGSILKNFGRGVSKVAHGATVPAVLPPAEGTVAHARELKEARARQNMVGASSRSAGVRPSKGAAGLDRSSRYGESLESIETLPPRHVHDQGPPIAGPSRGGFVSSLHGPIASTSKAAPTTSTTSRMVSPAPTSRSRVASPRTSESPSLPTSPQIPVLVLPAIQLDPSDIPPPSKILPSLSELTQRGLGATALLPHIRLLAQSVALYPFPPPSVSAASLSEALALHAVSPFTETAPVVAAVAPIPTPLQIYFSQASLLRHDSPTEVREAVLDLMRACVESSLGSTGGMKESEKAVYWKEALRWAEDAKVETIDQDGHSSWRLPDADREALVAILSALTRGGRDLSDVPGLVALLCAFVAESLPSPAPPSPLFDPTLKTPFLRSPPRLAAHTTSLALLTALHKFSAPHIYSASTLLALRASLQVARAPEERDLGGRDGGVIEFLSAVVRFGEVTSSKAGRAQATDAIEMELETEGDEILREVVSVVARIIGCEGLVGAVELAPGQKLALVHDERIHPSILPPLASQLMRDLLRSPANQALKSLRNSLVAPPTTGVIPPAPVLLLVGTLRSLRTALLEHSVDAEASASRGESIVLPTGESRWPSMLSLGLPYLWEGLRRVMLWQSEYIDAEVVGLVEERIEAARRRGRRAKQLSESEVVDTVAARAARAKELDELEGGVTFEEWDMAIEVLSHSKAHIAIWEEQQTRHWTVEDSMTDGLDTSGSENGSKPAFTRRPSVLSAFSSLFKLVLAAWCSPEFTGPSEQFFTLLLSISAHLSEADSIAVLDQCERDDLCLPTHPEWLERTQEVLVAFYSTPSRTAGPTARTIRRIASTATRRRALQLLTGVYSHVRQLESLSEQLVGTMFLPLLETTFENETDVEVAEELMLIVIEIGRDALSEEETIEDGPLGTFARLRLLLVRLAKGNGRTFDRRYSLSLPNTPRMRSNGMASLSRYHKHSLPTKMRSSPSISAPINNARDASVGAEPETTSVPYVSVLTLISLFHLCLARSTRSSSEKAIPIFRDLLALLSPVPNPADPLQHRNGSDVDVSVRARLVILQWLMRLRADANHRIHWIKNVDVAVSAEILGRMDNTPEMATEALVGAARRNSDEGGRGRAARPLDPNVNARNERDASGSRGRQRDGDPSPSRRNASRARPQAAPTTPTLWTVPEVLPFDFGASITAVGMDGLASFDHNRMRDWTEEEDPGTGLMKVKEVDDTVPLPHELAVVLPVSEYLAAICRLIADDGEWEIISYILCYLPEQLSNKHFSCGPRVGQQIHVLRRLLCDGLRGGERVFLTDVLLPPTLKRAEVHAATYHCLTGLIAFRSLFSKSQQDDMVETFMFGLGNPRDTAKPCIHALAMACFELRPSMTKHLAEIVRHLQKIISSATLGVHILELIAGIGQEPGLYANFTEQDFQTVFGIALKYIQAHNERLGDQPNESSAAPGEELAYAFSQYVFLLAYYSIAAWYMALRLSERPKYVPFLIRRLVQANEGRNEIDEATEVCFDMIARYAYSNADPRPRQSTFDKIITAGRTDAASTKTWIIGTSFVSVRNLQAPAWVEVTIRRASGVVKMLWELQNVSGVGSSSDCDLIAMHLRHRETAQLARPDLPSIISDALSLLPDAPNQPHIGRRGRANSYAGPEATQNPRAAITQNTVEGVLNLAAASAAQPTLESGPLAVDPSFFALQLSTIPDFGASGPPILVPNEPSYLRGISILDTIPVVDFHKVGVLYVGAGQTSEVAILGNRHGSKAYIELISGLGRLVRLKGCRERDVYTGGLDAETDIDGKWTYVWDDDISQIVFHVATLMPTNPETDPQSTLKKRHIGNDYVKIIYNDSGGEFAFDTLPGDFNFVNIVVQPHTPAGNPWVGPGMTNNAEFFKVSMQCRAGMPEIGPLGTFKMVAGSSLPNFVRQLSLHSNIFAHVYLATVGIEARQGTQKLEYSSNWRRRLQEIKRLKTRLTAGAVDPVADPKTRIDLETEENRYDFSQWT